MTTNAPRKRPIILKEGQIKEEMERIYPEEKFMYPPPPSPPPPPPAEYHKTCCGCCKSS